MEHIHTVFFARREGEIDALNGLRALAILAVFFLHLYVPAGPFLGIQHVWIDQFARNLTSGVDLFFVLSGFLVYGHLRDMPFNSGNLLHYARKRIRRIIPAYYVALLGAALYVYNLSEILDRAGQIDAAAKLQRSLTASWADLLFLSNYFPDRLLEPGWSLSLEIHFYLLLPLFALWMHLYTRRGEKAAWLPVLLMTAGLLIPLGFRLLQIDNGMIYFYTHTRFDALLAGMIVAEVHRRGKQPGRYGRMLMFSAGCLLLLTGHLCEIDGMFYRTYRYTFFAVGFGLLLYTALISQGVSRCLSAAPWRFMARISYTMYLWHPIFATVVLRNAAVDPVSISGLRIGLTWLAAFSLTVLGSSILYWIIERPFQSGTWRSVCRCPDSPERAL